MPSTLNRIWWLLFPLLACAESHGIAPLLEQRPVILMPGLAPDGVVFVVPTVVALNAPFAVTYATFGSSSCSRHLAPELANDGTRILIIPRLAPLPPNTPCTDDLATNRHTITLTWSIPADTVGLVLRGFRFDGTGVEVRRTVRVASR